MNATAKQSQFGMKNAAGQHFAMSPPNLSHGGQTMGFGFQKSGTTLRSVFMGIAIGATIALTSSTAAHAWGTDGHHVISLIAQSQLTPKAKAEVDRLLALEPGETLVSISTWADEHRNPATGPWHYVNFPRNSCVYAAERDCQDDQCVVVAIQKALRILDSKGSDEKRLTALKYLVHFIGDVHQPLHAGFQDDRGGNKYQVQAFGKGSNLHALWDSGLIKNMNEDAEHMAARLSAMPVPVVAIDLDAVHAAEESCLIVSAPGFYPEHKLSAEYVDRYTEAVEKRLRLAGVRLAGVLNRVFQ